MIATAGHGPTVLWYVTRGAGATTIVLLTASVALGIGEVRRWRPGRTSLYTVAALHRTLSLLALVFLAIHVVTTLLDPFPPIGVLAAIIPFSAHYRPLWLGFGTLASDLLVALVLTSLVRRRLGYRSWRFVHWFAYACWPVAILHGLGTGSDTRVGWMLVLTMACVAVVAATLLGRLADRGIEPRMRIAGGGVLTLGVIALGVWTVQGPLASGWARRAGTPPEVLAAFRPAPAPVAVRTAVAAAPPVDALSRPFAATLSGRLHNGVGGDGTAVVDLTMRLAGGPDGILRIRLGGEALPDGGLRMDRSAVTLGPPSDPARYQGRISTLQGTRIDALVGGPDGSAERLAVRLSIQDAFVSGQVHGTPYRVSSR